MEHAQQARPRLENGVFGWISDAIDWLVTPREATTTMAK